MSNQKGFSLVKTIVLLVIAGGMIFIFVSTNNSKNAKKRDRRRVADLKTIQAAIGLYYSENAHYPDNVRGKLGEKPNNMFCTSGFKARCVDHEDVYLGRVPADPATSEGREGYLYFVDKGGKNYVVQTVLEKGYETYEGKIWSTKNGIVPAKETLPWE